MEKVIESASIADPKAPSKSRNLIRRLVIAGSLILLIVLFSILIYRLFFFTRNLSWIPYWLIPIIKFGLLWSGLYLILLCYKTWLWYQYRALPLIPESEVPNLTVIIPAYNEGPMVAHSIESVICARYPRQRLEMIIIDDGSTDDTWEHIRQAVVGHLDWIKLVRFPQNQGKRAGLMKGFELAGGEVIVTIDSDSVISRDTLLAIVSPFLDRRVGAVAGKVLVHNADEGLIPKMLEVAYVLSFDFLRAVESQYRNVYCCPGALAAYRTSVVRMVQERWFYQSFLGSRCTYGEDRALTNYILGEGYDALYQNTALVFTVVPNRYSKLCKMFLRWNRSFIREEIHLLSRAVWQRPIVPRLAVLVDKLITDTRYPLRYSLGIITIAGLYETPSLAGPVMLGMLLGSTMAAIYYLKSNVSWRCLNAFPYAVFAILTLWWILPYAAMTLRNRSWMTR